MKKYIKKIITKYFPIILVSLIILVVVVISGIVKSIDKKYNWNATEISEKLYNEISSINRYKNIDKKENELYISKSILYDTTINGGKQEDNNWAITIKVFENNKQAEVMYKYFEWGNSEYSKRFTKENYGTYYENIPWKNTYNYLDGNVLIRMTLEYSEEKRNEILNYFKEIETMYIQKEKNIPVESNYVDEELQKLKNLQTERFNGYELELKNKINSIASQITTANEEKLVSLEKELNKYYQIPIIEEEYKNAKSQLDIRKQYYNEQKEENANNITSKLNEIKKSLSKNELDAIKEEIDDINDDFYNSYIQSWNNTIKEIENKIKENEISEYKKECKNLSYKNVLRNPENYLYEKAYWFGVIYQDVGYGNYRVGIDCTKYKYSSGYSCDNTIYVTYYGDEKFIEDDVVKMWGYMNGTKTYTTVLGASMTIPKFVAEYITLQ